MLKTGFYPLDRIRIGWRLQLVRQLSDFHCCNRTEFLLPATITQKKNPLRTRNHRNLRKNAFYTRRKGAITSTASWALRSLHQTKQLPSLSSAINQKRKKEIKFMTFSENPDLSDSPNIPIIFNFFKISTTNQQNRIYNHQSKFFFKKGSFFSELIEFSTIQSILEEEELRKLRRGIVRISSRSKKKKEEKDGKIRGIEESEDFCCGKKRMWRKNRPFWSFLQWKENPLTDLLRTIATESYQKH